MTGDLAQSSREKTSITEACWSYIGPGNVRGHCSVRHSGIVDKVLLGESRHSEKSTSSIFPRVDGIVQHTARVLQEERNGRGLVISRLGTSLLHLLITNFQDQRAEWIIVIFRLPCVFSSATDNDPGRTVSAQRI